MQLNNGKIIFLGEKPHNSVVHYNAVERVIQEWINLQKAHPSKKKLALVLEYDSSEGVIINDYVNNGNDSALRATFITYLTYETMEFFASLHKLKLALDSSNSNESVGSTFEVACFEEYGYEYNDEKAKHMRQSEEESEKWFINERDEHTSERFMRYVRSDTNLAVLISYGSAHIQDGYVNKRLDNFQLDESLCYGYYLCYFLRKDLGKDKVLTIIPVFFGPQELKRDFPDRYRSAPFLESADDISYTWAHVLKADMFIVSECPQLYPHPFGYTFSKFVIGKLYEQIVKAEALLPGYLAKINFYTALGDIFFITGQKFNSSTALEDWKKGNKSYNGFERMDAEEFEYQLKSVYKKSYEFPSAREVLYGLGFTDKDFESEIADSVFWHNQVWLEVQPKMKFMNCVGIYWVGYPIEMERAKEYLVQYTGQDYKEPEKYLQWYRKNILGVDY